MGQMDAAPARLPRIITIVGLLLGVGMVAALLVSGGRGGTTPAPTQPSGAVSNARAVDGVNCREVTDAQTVTTASGLQYQILRDCDGANPTAASNVTVHYRGTLADGTQFDSSYDRGQPISFSLGGVIAGWTEGLQLMSVGERFRFIIPPDLAYGAAGRPGIPSNATLTFEVELIGFQ
jgi:FKBP-type peptidyl-prolyl cis-trans isomerase FkpA